MGRSTEVGGSTASLSSDLGIAMAVTPVHDQLPRRGRPTYRAFLLKADGGILSAQVVDAQSDDEARAIAAGMTNGHGITLWERGRFLANYPPHKPAGSG